MGPSQAKAAGRPRVSSRTAIEQTAIHLFLSEGYEEVTIERIAAACGVGRATIFRYFDSKSDVVFSAFDAVLETMAASLRSTSPRTPVTRAVAICIVESTRQAVENPVWLDRFVLLDTSPGLRAGATSHWERWTEVIETYLQERYSWPAGDVRPAAFAGALRGAYVALLRRPTNVQADPAAFVADLEAALEPISAALKLLLRPLPH